MAKARASSGYVAYSRSLLSEGPEPADVRVVDVQGSGQSSHRFFKDHLGLRIRQLFIYTGQSSLASYQAEGLLPRSFVRRRLPQACDLLEMMNYSTDHSLLDMHQLPAHGFIQEFEAEMRPARLLEICQAFETFFHDVKQLMHQGAFRYLFLQHDLRNYRREHPKLLQDVDRLKDLRLLRELNLRFHRRHYIHSMSIVLHIGSHKTGTTAIPGFLERNREGLRQRASGIPPRLNCLRMDAI